MTTKRFMKKSLPKMSYKRFMKKYLPKMSTQRFKKTSSMTSIKRWKKSLPKMSTKPLAYSLTDLPSNAIGEILSRLPLRTIFVSKSVCKTFTRLTSSNPHFINLHSSNASQIIVFQFGEVGIPSYQLRMADLNHNSKLEPFFQLPIMAPLSPCFSQDVCSFFLVNSCNGLVYFLHSGRVKDTRSILCNPVTNEYIVVPDPKTSLDSVTVSIWLGFSPGTDQYKVLRIFYLKEDEVLAQLSVVGSDSWRYIEDAPRRISVLFRDTPESLVNGVMYWHHPLWSKLFSFDFEEEKFGEVALPLKFSKFHLMSIGVLGGCVCLSCNHFIEHRVDLWVMRKDGNQVSWRKEFAIDIDKPVYGHFRSLQFLRNGEILMLLVGYGLVLCDPRSKTIKRFALDRRVKLDYRVMALTPSFVPLKDTLKVDNVMSELRPRGDRILELREEEEM